MTIAPRAFPALPHIQSEDPAFSKMQDFLRAQQQVLANNPALSMADWRVCQTGSGSSSLLALQFRTPPTPTNTSAPKQPPAGTWTTVASFTSAGVLSPAPTTTFTPTWWSLAAKPLVADSRDEEFEGTLAAWTAVGTDLGSAPDVLTAFNTAGSFKKSLNSQRPSWLLIQPTYATATCGYIKPVTYNTKDFVYCRVSTGQQLVAGTNLQASASLLIGDPSPSVTNYVVVTISNSGLGGSPCVGLSTNVGDVVRKDLSANVSTAVIQYLGLLKSGTTYYAFMAAADGTWQYIGKTTHATTMTAVQIYSFNSAAPTDIGNPIQGFDFVRFVASPTNLP